MIILITILHRGTSESWQDRVEYIATCMVRFLNYTAKLLLESWSDVRQYIWVIEQCKCLFDGSCWIRSVRITTV